MTQPRPIRTLATLLLSALAAASIYADFAIRADKASFEPGSPVSLHLNDVAEKRLTQVASARIDASGGLDLSTELPPGIYELSIGDLPALPLAIAEGQKIEISYRESDEDPWRVEGSPDTDKLHAYETFRKDSLNRLVYPPRVAARAANSKGKPAEEIARLTQAEVDGYAAHRRELNDFTIATVGDSMALYATALRWDLDYRPQEIQRLVESFAETHGELSVTKTLRQKLETGLALAIGKQAPELAGYDLNQQRQTLSDQRGKYVLIDFWASWCPPCRIENQHYQTLVSELPKETFTLFAVNLDSDKRLWEQASRRDRISWIQISDDRGLSSPLAERYAVSSLPSSFLLDQQGRIIAKNLRGPALDAKLKELGLL
ncbi:TlpA disulfide reductase family protein [Pelagicoccus sp. SDUM812003]|uniref:TlpA family protein disulfide reductase n=1 Tax=Pelagicoccus sp. SDUM812003 TaxID=3041267 RepID=UPI0028107327|nr:TlpA disulfide reductase family protein [Pelagicoccus sp. SDUM812003]MDQ8202033.1 TlpA disulfide reductase family protein [Pelagicoccus sp. SDUM812003]